MIDLYILYKIVFLWFYFIVNLIGYLEVYDLLYFFGLSISRKFY